MLTLPMMIYDKTGLNMTEYFSQKGMKVNRGNTKYVSRRMAKVLDEDNIPWRESSIAQISGGSNGAVFYIKDSVLKLPDGSLREVDQKEAEELLSAYNN